MTAEQKVQARNLVLGYLEAVAESQPTALIDVLLSGDGYNILNRLIQGEEMAARARAQALNNLLQAVRQAAPPQTYQQPPPPPQTWTPPPMQPPPGFRPAQDEEG